MNNKKVDYISGVKINATPEELEAIQPLAKELVEICGYHKGEIKTHPQFRIALSPSDEKKSYPVDIAVLENNKLKIICECKKISSQEGKEQLRKYLRMCEAKFGVWFNGEERLILQKVETSQGISFKEINDILPYGIWEETHPLYEELKPREDLKSVFYQIKKNLQKNIIGSTNEPDIAKDFLKVLFCKIFDERYQDKSSFTKFYAYPNNSPKTFKEIREIFIKVKTRFEDVFGKNEEINFDEKTIVFITQKLQWISLINSGRDAVADAFEVFIGTALKGEHGQFFTPRNVVRFVISFLNLNETQKIIDPACGTGGFIVESLRHVWKNLNDRYSVKWKKEEIEREKINVARENIFGCDKDSFLAQACKGYMCILGDGAANIWNNDSLKKFAVDWERKYDIILTNPPFGKTIMVEEKEILKNFVFWQQGSKSKAEPQILFLELCCNLLKKNGKLAIVLPEGIFGNSTYKKVRKTLLQRYKIIAVFSLPPETFKPSNGIKTSILVLENSNANDNDKIIFADIQNVGHDKKGGKLYKYDSNGIPFKDENGNFIINDELNTILEKIHHQEIIYYQKATEKDQVFFITHNDLKQTNDLILIPSYYNGFLNKNNLENNQLVLTFQELIENKIIETNQNDNLPAGDEIGSKNYLTDGTIPFIRTSDIANLEIKYNPQHYTNEQIYRRYKDKQDLRPYDILFVKDGKHLVGECAMIMPEERETIISSGFYKIRLKSSPTLIQSHILKLRVKVENDWQIDAWNLLYSLYSRKTKEQIDKLLFRSTIPHLSNRIREVKLYFPKNKQELLENSKVMKEILTTKFELKKELKKIYNQNKN